MITFTSKSVPLTDSDIRCLLDCIELRLQVSCRDDCVLLYNRLAKYLPKSKKGNECALILELSE